MHSPDAHHELAPLPPAESVRPAPPVRAPSRARRAVTRALGAGVALAVAAEVVLQLPPVREAIRARAERALGEEWPGATIARCAAADVTGVARFDGVRLPLGERAGVVLDGLEVSLEWSALVRGRVRPSRVNAADTFVEADVPGVGKVGLGADEGARLALAVVELPSAGSPARVRVSGPSRGCLPTGRCLTAQALLEAEASREDGGLRVRWQALADAVRIRPNDVEEQDIPLPGLAAHGEAARAGAVSAFEGQLSVGPHGFVDAKGTVTGDSFRVDVSCSTPSWSDLLDSIPLGIPEEARLAVDGPLEASAKISGPLADPDAWQVDASLDSRTLVAGDAGRGLVEPFLYQPRADPDAPAIWMGTRNPDFLPLSQTPEVVVWSVLLSEDSEFFTHPGFDVPAMVDALKTNLKEKRVHRGGSTVSQQLVKNLWLSRDRTLQRKLQEAALTVSLEAAVPKERILEIYLNGIEWGPGIYGVRRAAKHYFDKEPGELTAKEAAYLATVIPNPRGYYGYFRRGALTESWEQRVMHVIEKLRDAGLVSVDEYEEAAWTPLRFASSGDDPWTTEIETATVAPLED